MWRTRSASVRQKVFSAGFLSASFALVGAGYPVLSACGGLLARTKLELCAHREGAGGVVSEGFIKRVLYALRLDLPKSWEVL